MIVTSFCSSGTGKTTLLAHLAYYAASQGVSTALIELDNRNSLKRCCGLSNASFHTSNLFDSGFKGDYNFLPLWESHLKGKAEICPADRKALLETEQSLASKPLGILKLKKIFKKYPLSHQLILLDSPGQEGVMSASAILASDYVILSIEATPKAMSDAIRFVEILFNYEEEYDVEIPRILGIVVGRYDQESATARNILEQLPDIAEQISTRLFAPIRHSHEFLNAYELGIPLHLHRPGHKAVGDFSIDGNIFKDMSERKIRNLDRSYYESLPAIAKFIVKIVKHNG